MTNNIFKDHPIVELDIGQIKKDPSNPNMMTSLQMKGLEKSLQKFGRLKHIVVDQNNVLIDGEHRLEIEKANGTKKINVIKVEIKNEIERKMIRETLNQLYGTYDKQKQSNELSAILKNNRLDELSELLAKPKTEFMTLIGKYNPQIITDYGYHEFDEKKELDNIGEPITKNGDVIKLGKHILICADSKNDKNNILNFISDKKISLIFTDPPYDMQNNDLEQVFTNFKDVTDLQFWMMGDKQAVYLCAKFYDMFSRFYVHDYIQSTVISNKQAMIQHNLIAQFGTRESRNLYDGFSTIIKINTLRTTPSAHKNFKWGKRPELIEKFISHFAQNDEYIFDMFGGSGSTMMAAEKCMFPSIIVEKEPRYCDLIIKRFESTTNIKAERNT